MAASQKKHIVAVSNVGGQLPSEYHTIRAVFHNFASLPAKRDDAVYSDPMECHGVEWRICLYPGGCNDSEEDKEHLSIYLSCLSVLQGKEKQVKTVFRGSIHSGVAQKVLVSSMASTETVYQEGVTSTGWPNFVKRSIVLDPENKYLKDGNLMVDFDIRISQDKPLKWMPTPGIGADMLKLLEEADGSSAAVIFEVGKEEDTGSDDDQNKELFYAHRPILSARSPTLATIAEGFGRGTHIPIGDVQPDVFRMLLRYIYGEEVPSNDVLTDKAREIMHVADRFGCVGLKLAAESELVASGIHVDNAADLLLLADAGHHALLKEAAMHYFVTHSDAVMATEGYEQVNESPAIMKELIAALSAGTKKKWPVGDLSELRGNYNDMCVAALRVKLSKKSLDVDGSMVMLIERLVAADAEEVETTEANTAVDADDAVDESSFSGDEDDDSDAEEENPVAV